MASSDQIKALLQSHVSGDDPQFYAIAMQVAATAARKGQIAFAQEVRNILERAQRAAKEPVPIARPSEELAGLLTASYPKIRVQDVILADPVAIRLKQVLKEQQNIDKLGQYGLSPSRKLLLTGPPGCGKTLTAAALAGQLGIPLFTVRLDGLITRYLGESIAKLRLIFDAMRNRRAVYFFDEFDSIGMQRSFANDVGEIKRVLNSFLMYIEQDESTSLIIAATNYAEVLDYALFRRFDELFEFNLPTQDLVEQVLKVRLAAFPNSNLDYSQLGKQALGLSFAEIVHACGEAIKQAILSDSSTVSMEILQIAINARVEFRNRLFALNLKPAN